MHCRQPGRCHPKQTNAKPDTQTKPQRIGDVLGSNGLRQVSPGLAGSTDKKIQADAGHRQTCQHGNQNANNQQRGIRVSTQVHECEL